MNWKLLLGGLCGILPLTWILWSGFGKDPRALPFVLDGQPAPAFELLTLEGETLSLESLQGKPLVINFWATWCRPCAQEHPYLVQAARAYGPQGVQFLGVLYGDEPARAAAWLKQAGTAYPSLIDPDQRTAIDYGVGGVPETFFVDREGVIVEKISGPVHPQLLQEILEEMI